MDEIVGMKVIIKILGRVSLSNILAQIHKWEL